MPGALLRKGRPLSCFRIYSQRLQRSSCCRRCGESDSSHRGLARFGGSTVGPIPALVSAGCVLRYPQTPEVAGELHAEAAFARGGESD